MPLSDIVNVQITRQTQSVSEMGFGTPMILGTFKNWNDLIRQYSDMQEVATDFVPSQLEYIAAQAVFAQPITPPYIYIGRRAVNTVGIEVETALPNETYTTTINGQAITVNSTSVVQDSVLSVSGLIKYSLQFSSGFDSTSIIAISINGLPLTPVTWQGSNGATYALIISTIAANSNVSSCFSGGANQVYVIFNASVNNTVSSVVVTGNVVEPTCVITIATGPIVTSNLINVSLNGTILGTVTSIIDFDINFVSLNSILATVNAIALTPVVFSTDQATTIGLLASMIATATGVASATVTGTKEITVVFTNPGNNTVNSVVTTLGASQPVATISEGGYTFTTDSPTTLGLIVTDLTTALNVGYTPGIATVTLTGINNNIISIFSNPGQAGEIDFFTVTLGASQATGIIVNSPQPTDLNTIAYLLSTAINGSGQPVTSTLPALPNGTFSISANAPDFLPFSLAVSTSIVEPDTCRVSITQTIPNETYTVKINGTSFSYLAPNNVIDNLQIAAGLVAAINTLYPLPPATPIATLQPVTATDNLDGTFEIAANVPGVPFQIQVFPFNYINVQFGLIIQPYTTSQAVASDLIAIQDVNDDWYALACTNKDIPTQKAIADWVETQIKIYGIGSADLNIINQAAGTDNTSIAWYINSKLYIRSFVLYSADAIDDFPECAWMGNVLPTQPGSETWAFKTLRGIAYSNLTSTQQSNAFNKEANVYQYIGGVGITQNGTVGSGEYIDIVRGVDWLTSTIQSYVFSVLVNNPKVPYTNAGITLIESQIRRALELGVANNFIADAPPYQVFIPDATTVPAIDKVNRILRNVKFQATLAGAIQAVQITGVVSV